MSTKRRKVPTAGIPPPVQVDGFKDPQPPEWVSRIVVEYPVYPGDNVPTIAEALDYGYVVSHTGCAEDETEGFTR